MILTRRHFFVGAAAVAVTAASTSALAGLAEDRYKGILHRYNRVMAAGDDVDLASSRMDDFVYYAADHFSTEYTDEDVAAGKKYWEEKHEINIRNLTDVLVVVFLARSLMHDEKVSVFPEKMKAFDLFYDNYSEILGKIMRIEKV